jgi:hypothetical protein
VAVGKKRDEDVFHNVFLAHDYFADFGTKILVSFVQGINGLDILFKVWY